MPNVAKLESIVITTYCLIVQSFSKCPEACAACEDNTCYACKDGYFLYNGVCRQCPITCRLCQSQYICTDCKPNYWNLSSQCSTQCPSNCLSGCNASTGDCFGCKSNFYGKNCAHDCTLCRYGLCDYNGCAYGCVDGYFHDIIQGYILCKKCSPNCLKCENVYNCTECQPYFYKYLYKQVVNQVSRSECMQCSPGCVSCIDVDRCLSCQHIKCENNCSINCMKNKNSQPECNVLTGSCTYGCVGGFTGSACDVIAIATETINTTYIPEVEEPNVDEVKTFPLAAIVGALVGAIVVGAVSVMVVVILWKRLRKKPEFRSHVYANAGIDITQHDENPASSIELSVPSSETSVYEHLSCKTNKNDYSDNIPQKKDEHLRRSILSLTGQEN